MSVSAARLLVPPLSEMSYGIRAVSNEAETSCCCRCHQAWPISTSAGAVRYTEDHDQRVHHDRRPSHITHTTNQVQQHPQTLADAMFSRSSRIIWPNSCTMFKTSELKPSKDTISFLRVETTALLHRGLRNSCFMQVCSSKWGKWWALAMLHTNEKFE